MATLKSRVVAFSLVGEGLGALAVLFAEHNWLVFVGESTGPADPLSHLSSKEATLEHDVHE